jgi:hypothetical protein
VKNYIVWNGNRHDGKSISEKKEKEAKKVHV